MTPLDSRIYADLDHLRRVGGKARGLSFLPRQPSGSILNGRHASRIRGRGLDFEDLRQYVRGDDVRTIDWKVTARTREPHVRVYREEKDRQTLLVVDQRISMFFGSRVYTKSVIAAEAASIAAHRVLDQGDRVGGLIFSDGRIAEHRPVRSPHALTRLLSSIADANTALSADRPDSRTPSLNDVLTATARIAKTNVLVMVFSDFDTDDPLNESTIRRIAAHNDLIVFDISDPLSQTMPMGGKLTVTDAALQAEIDMDRDGVGDSIVAVREKRLADLHAMSRKYAFPIVPMTTEEPALDQMLRQFGLQRGRG